MPRPTTPSPGTLGGAPQTTTTHYNQALRARRTMQRDGNSVTNEFHSGGALKKQSGSHTYPVEYTYEREHERVTH